MARKIKYEDVVNTPGWIQAEGTKWDPDVGDSLVGVLKSITTRPKPQKPNEKITTYRVETPDKIWRVVGSTVLDDLMGDGPEIGDAVAIKHTHTGKNPYNKNNPIKYFDVIYKKQGQTETKTTENPTSEKVQNSDVAENATTENKEPVNSLNPKDNTEINEIVNGIEEDLKNSGTAVTELNMFKAAKAQLEYEKKTLESANAEIRKRDYPKRAGA